MDLQTIGYIALITTLIMFIVLLVRADRTIETLEDEVELNANSAAFWCSMYFIANEANIGMAEGLEQYRTTFGELAALEPVAPTTDTDTLVASMKYCLACCTYRHPIHFTLYPLHASGQPPA